MLWVLICRVHLSVCYYHATFQFQGESTLCSSPDCQGHFCPKQAPYLKFKWRQWDSNPQPLSTETNTQPFSQAGQMIELCCEYLSVPCILLYVIIILSASFRVNRHSIVCLNVKEVLARTRCHFWSLSDNNEIPTQKHLVRKRTLNHLAELVKWLSCVVSPYLCAAFDCMLLSFHNQVSEWNQTL